MPWTDAGNTESNLEYVQPTALQYNEYGERNYREEMTAEEIEQERHDIIYDEMTRSHHTEIYNYLKEKYPENFI
jgi:hypothetical protein